jgi:hypothetical protein
MGFFEPLQHFRDSFAHSVHKSAGGFDCGKGSQLRHGGNRFSVPPGADQFIARLQQFIRRRPWIEGQRLGEIVASVVDFFQQRQILRHADGGGLGGAPQTKLGFEQSQESAWADHGGIERRAS